MIDLALIDEARAARRRQRRRQARHALTVSAAITLSWALAVTVFGQWPRVAGHWVSSLTMVFGSFVAGATPQGGGAVAFPVFTKLLEVPAEVARSFSLCIQSVGMGTASASILLNRHRVEWRAIGLMTLAGALGFLACFWLASDATRPFRPSLLPGQLAEGEVDDGVDDALSKGQKKRGLILACQARPRSPTLRVRFD